MIGCRFLTGVNFTRKKLMHMQTLAITGKSRLLRKATSWEELVHSQCLTLRSAPRSRPPKWGGHWAATRCQCLFTYRHRSCDNLRLELSHLSMIPNFPRHRRFALDTHWPAPRSALHWWRWCRLEDVTGILRREIAKV